MLGTFVVLYLFLGGAGAGVLFVAAVWSLLFHRTVTRTFEQKPPFRALAGSCTSPVSGCWLSRRSAC